MAVYAVEDLVNIALRQIGYPTPIGSIHEGSDASRVALDLYGQIRDELLRVKDWDFARVTVSLGAALKTAPVAGYGAVPWSTAYPPLPWIYSYGYPANCIEVRTLLPTPIFLPEMLPRVVLWEKGNDTALGVPVVLTDLAGAQATITAAIYDPAQWKDPGFIQALVDALAQKFLRPLMGEGDPNVQGQAAQMASGAAMVGTARQG